MYSFDCCMAFLVRAELSMPLDIVSWRCISVNSTAISLRRLSSAEQDVVNVQR